MFETVTKWKFDEKYDDSIQENFIVCNFRGQVKVNWLKNDKILIVSFSGLEWYYKII